MSLDNSLEEFDWRTGSAVQYRQVLYLKYGQRWNWSILLNAEQSPEIPEGDTLWRMNSNSEK